tara:strand:- start:503 stop:2002 length:1500 start_codon:yes stop_codon:yes gene_type:complete
MLVDKNNISTELKGGYDVSGTDYILVIYYHDDPINLGHTFRYAIVGNMEDQPAPEPEPEPEPEPQPEPEPECTPEVSPVNTIKSSGLKVTISQRPFYLEKSEDALNWNPEIPSGVPSYYTASGELYIFFTLPCILDGDDCDQWMTGGMGYMTYPPSNHIQFTGTRPFPSSCPGDGKYIFNPCDASDALDLENSGWFNGDGSFSYDPKEDPPAGDNPKSANVGNIPSFPAVLSPDFLPILAPQNNHSSVGYPSRALGTFNDVIGDASCGYSEEYIILGPWSSAHCGSSEDEDYQGKNNFGLDNDMAQFDYLEAVDFPLVINDFRGLFLDNSGNVLDVDQGENGINDEFSYYSKIGDGNGSKGFYETDNIQRWINIKPQINWGFAVQGGSQTTYSGKKYNYIKLTFNDYWQSQVNNSWYCDPNYSGGAADSGVVTGAKIAKAMYTWYNSYVSTPGWQSISNMNGIIIQLLPRTNIDASGSCTYGIGQDVSGLPQLTDYGMP